MISVFTSMDSYVDFLTTLPIVPGEIFCTSFLPSAFFPKDAVKLYFEQEGSVDNPTAISEHLWNYGKRVIQALENEVAILCIEQKALTNLCLDGTVHVSSPQYELGFATRIHVLRQIKRAALKNTVFLTTQPLAFTCRIHPPNGLLLDVNTNVVYQKVQGIWLEDITTYEAFKLESKRLIQSSIDSGRGLLDKLDEAINTLSQAAPFVWNKSF